jgi:tripartite-type tricarboxylate transporter receptor subunit TctC
MDVPNAARVQHPRSRSMIVAAALVTTAWAVSVADAATHKAKAESVADFYRGKQVSLYIGYSSGGGYDIYGRIVAKHLGKHIPGNPAVVPRNMEGAGSLRLANFLYQVAPKDGTAIGTVGRANAFAPLFGYAGAQFDAQKYTWLGSANDEVAICAAWHTSGFKTFNDMRVREMTVGSTGATDEGAQIGKGMNAFLGTKLRTVTGYPGGNQINLAMERGEVDGRCALSWSSVKTAHQDWLDRKQINVLMQISFTRHADLPHVPALLDHAPNDEARQILKFLVARQVMGRPFLAPPDLPADRAAALRKAFIDTLNDPELLAEADRTRLEITPVSGQRIDDLLKELYGTPTDIVQKAAALFN